LVQKLTALFKARMKGAGLSPLLANG